MNLILFDDSRRAHLLPLTFTRPQAEIRIGILTITEKWEKLYKIKPSFLCEEYLRMKFPLKRESSNLLVSGSIIPNDEFILAVQGLKSNEALTLNGELIAANDSNNIISLDASAYSCKDYTGQVDRISNLWDIFSLNDKILRSDFERLTKGRKSADISPDNKITGTDFFAEEGAKAYHAIFNTSTGPIYLGKNTEVWEGSVIRGPFSLGDDSIVKLAAKIYGATTVGPHCRVGGEINNSVIFGYSNKGHDGFLGNSVLGEWCNIGADSNNSNLKNNYAEVKLWNYPKQGFVSTGLQFCGLIMADHSKCGINTMFNTGTVVGVSSNIFGSGFPRNFIPSFSWGGAQGMSEYKLSKAEETAQKVMERRHIDFDKTEKEILSAVHQLSSTYRQGG